MYHYFSQASKVKKISIYPLVKIFLAYNPYTPASSYNFLNELIEYFKIVYIISHNIGTWKSVLFPLSRRWSLTKWSDMFFNVRLCCLQEFKKTWRTKK